MHFIHTVLGFDGFCFQRDLDSSILSLSLPHSRYPLPTIITLDKQKLTELEVPMSVPLACVSYSANLDTHYFVPTLFLTIALCSPQTLPSLALSQPASPLYSHNFPRALSGYLHHTLLRINTHLPFPLDWALPKFWHLCPIS